MAEMRGEGNVDAGGPVQGSWISGQGRLIIGGRVYSSQRGVAHYNVERPRSEVRIPSEDAPTIMGQEVEHTIAIYESVPLEGDVRQYESRIDGEVVWSGAGDDRVEALLQ